MECLLRHTCTGTCTCTCTCIYMYNVHVIPPEAAKLTALGVLCYFALIVICFTFLASFFLPSSSLINMYMYNYTLYMYIVNAVQFVYMYNVHVYQCTRVTRVGLSQIQKKHKQNLRKHAATPTSTVAPPLPTITTLTASQSSPLTPHSSASFPAFPSSPPHKDLPDPLPPPSGDHLGGQKGHQTGHTSHGNQSHRARNRDKERKEGPQKRISADAPIPPAKRKNRRRKLSSSNESSTSEAPSNASDFIHASSHQPLEQANAMAALREGREGRGLERVAAMRKRESEILTAVPTYSKRDGSRIGSHSVSPVPALETDRGKESAASRLGEMWSRIIR